MPGRNPLKAELPFFWSYAREDGVVASSEQLLRRMVWVNHEPEKGTRGNPNQTSPTLSDPVTIEPLTPSLANYPSQSK
jgi:hypothetical protein